MHQLYSCELCNHEIANSMCGGITEINCSLSFLFSFSYGVVTQRSKQGHLTSIPFHYSILYSNFVQFHLGEPYSVTKRPLGFYVCAKLR